MQTDRLFKLSTRRKFAGGAALAMIATLLVVAATTLAIRMTRQVEDRTERVSKTQARMERIRAALHAYAVTQGRLPCPVAGATPDNSPTGAGLAAPPGPSVTTCAARDGTVPWVSLGLRSEEAQDAWGRKISYRVFDDLVRDDGVKNTASTNGLSVKDEAPNRFAWVLISHGVSGLGAWLPNGMQILPIPASQESINTQAPGVKPFFRMEESVIDLDPATSLNHFDDLLLFESIVELKKVAGFDPGGGEVTGDVIKKLLENPNAIDTKGNGSGLTFIDLVTPDLGTVRISSTGGDISTDGPYPYQALGVCSSGCGAGNSSNRALDSSESLSFRLGTGKTAKGFALGLLGISNTTVAVSITFKKNGVTLANLIQSVAVTTAMPLSPQLTNLALTPPGTEFDEVVVQPVGTSRFFVANVFFCQGSICPNTGDVIKKLLEDPNAIDTKVNGSGLTFIDLVTPDLGTVRISSTGGDISTDDPYKALGVCSAGCGAANSSNRALDSSESLGFRLGTNKTAKSFALGLLGISNTTVDASITIKKNGVTLANLIESVAVTTAMPGSPQLKNHALTPPGTEFDEVVVQPVGTSRFFVANVFFCQAATCPSP